MNPLFSIPVHVKRLEGSDMPPDAAGAYLTCFSAAPDHKTAFDLVLATLSEDHYQYLEMNGDVVELDPTFWNEYLEATWPEKIDELPSSEDIRELQHTGGVAYGPFCCYPHED